MEDTLFPSPMSAGNPKELEEERRLFYVALTRAEKIATLTYALNRYKWGNLERSKPSRFLGEIDRNYIDYPQTGGKPFSSNIRSGTALPSLHEGQQAYLSDKGDRKLKKVTKPVYKNFTSSDTEESYSFSEGDTIHHERFGKGIIIAIDGEQPNTTALVEFEDKSRKKLLLRFAKLRKI
jgi:DNA helicase-2/ATP-dependent DNA helicase PcrA